MDVNDFKILNIDTTCLLRKNNYTPFAVFKFALTSWMFKLSGNLLLVLH